MPEFPIDWRSPVDGERVSVEPLSMDVPIPTNDLISQTYLDELRAAGRQLHSPGAIKVACRLKSVTIEMGSKLYTFSRTKPC